jgi:hypothetical protein
VRRLYNYYLTSSELQKQVNRAFIHAASFWDQGSVLKYRFYHINNQFNQQQYTERRITTVCYIKRVGTYVMLSRKEKERSFDVAYSCLLDFNI